MVVTVEPGVYLPGAGGVRLEDMVRVTGTRGERITYLPKTISRLV
jgi:Xaa-Pro aminopeptidase